MPAERKKFKQSPKRYHPKGMTILYEDHDILVIDKSSGMLSMGNEKSAENSAHFMLNTYVRKGNSKSKNRIYIVHRLDRDTSGVLVYAKSEETKSFLQDNWQDFSKTYHAVALGSFDEKERLITSYLVENSAHKVYATNDTSKGKKAQTRYKVLKENASFSLLQIELLTGRKNQIRVHLADMFHPIAGDRVYGERDKSIKRLMLHASQLTITHPYTKQKMTFEAPQPRAFSSLV